MGKHYAQWQNTDSHILSKISLHHSIITKRLFWIMFLFRGAARLDFLFVENNDRPHRIAEVSDTLKILNVLNNLLILPLKSIEHA